MRDVVANPPREEIDRAPDVPAEVEHVLVAAGDGRTYDAPAPSAYEGEGDRIQYEHGDELPLEQGRECLQTCPAFLVGLDSAGEIVDGGEGNRDELYEAIKMWEKGDTFDGNEYTE